MTLDERVRVGLRRSADTGLLEDDVVLDQIRTAYERGRVRGRVLRQATTVAVVLTLIAGIGVFVSLRAAPDRYRTTVAVAVNTGVPGYPGDPLKIALAPTTQRAALRAAHVAPTESRVRFDATSSSKSNLLLAVTSPSTDESALVTRHWIGVTTSVLKANATRQIIFNQRSISVRVRKLHEQLRRVDAELVKMDPVTYHGLLRFDAPNGNLPGTAPNAPPPVPEHSSVAELNLAFLRIQILQQITTLGNSAAVFGFSQITPNTYPRTVGPTSTTRVSDTPRAAWVTLSAWLLALLLVLIGGVFIYRRRAKSASVSRS